MEIISLDVLEVSSDDHFLDVDETSFGSLIPTAMGSLDSCSVEQYVKMTTFKCVLTLMVTNGRQTSWRL